MQKQIKQTSKLGKQRKNPQTKERAESPEKELNETKANNLLDIEFKVMVIRMLKELTDNYNELSGKHISMKKDRETLNKTN